MKIPTKIFLLGIVLLVFLVTGGVFAHLAEERAAQQKQELCKPWERYADSNLSPECAAITETYDSVSNSNSIYLSLAILWMIFIAPLFAVPWLWYFFLRRVREFRNAIAKD